MNRHTYRWVLLATTALGMAPVAQAADLSHGHEPEDLQSLIHRSLQGYAQHQSRSGTPTARRAHPTVTVPTVSPQTSRSAENVPQSGATAAQIHPVSRGEVSLTLPLEKGPK